MPSSFPFSEARIKALKPPAADREYHKDTAFPGLQVCVSATGAKVYYFVKRIDGKPARVKLGSVEQLSVAAARKAAAGQAGQIADGKNPQTERRQRRQEATLADLFAHWMLYAKAHKKPKSYLEDERQYNASLKAWAGRRLSSIKKPDVQSLHAKLGQENGIYAANRVLALLKAMFNRADNLGYRGDNPCHGVKPFREHSRDRFLQPGELAAFFQALDAEPVLFRDFFVVALLTGARKTNCLTMQWIDVDLDRGLWRIPETKAGVPLLVPLVVPVVTILDRRRQTNNGSPWVFPGHRHGDHLKEPKTSWKRIVTRAGLTDVRPHDLRRSLGSYMAIGNVGLPLIGRMLGHSQPATTAIYSRLTIDPVRAAAEQATMAILAAAGQQKLLGAQNGGNDGQTR